MSATHSTQHVWRLSLCLPPKRSRLSVASVLGAVEVVCGRQAVAKDEPWLGATYILARATDWNWSDWMFEADTPSSSRQFKRHTSRSSSILTTYETSCRRLSAQAIRAVSSARAICHRVYEAPSSSSFRRIGACAHQTAYVIRSMGSGFVRSSSFRMCSHSAEAWN